MARFEKPSFSESFFLKTTTAHSALIALSSLSGPHARIVKTLDTEAIEIFVTAPRSLVPLLAAELASLGGQGILEDRAGVACHGDLTFAYRICLWSRLASRVLFPLATFQAADAEELYRGASAVAWEDHLAAQGTLAVDCTLANATLRHSHYAALRVKDAVVDRFRELFGVLPSVAQERPDLRINLHIDKDTATLSLDLSGESLHRRGYREDGGLAPLKENLAAAILLRAGWPDVAAAGGALVDPMCGSGTLLLEGALMAADIAPGLLRPYFGFLGWKRHDPDLWERLVAEAQERRQIGLAGLPPIFGSDSDSRALRAARANADRAGLAERISITRREVADLLPPQETPAGLVVTNPPYGERLGKESALVLLYAALGRRLKEHFGGWRAAVFTGNPGLASHLALRAHRRHSLDNGALRCKLLHFTLAVRSQPNGEAPPRPLSAGAEMFANRLRKNLRTLRRWAEREKIDCYRLYDADMPEYAVAVDWYHGWVHIQEYAPPPSVDAQQARRRLREVMAATAAVLEVPRERIVLKVRRRQKGATQYERFDQRGAFQEVNEGGYRFLVNLTDYLDTGLFLDHRLTRTLVGSLARGKDFLNLFAYTGAASVHAAGGGARSTVSVDLSRTYLEWAERNLRLNGFTGPRHRLIQGDCLEWLAACRERFVLIFLDPPTFSNSKRMSATFDVQRDHVALLQQAARLLTADGVLIFSNNNRRFRMDHDALGDLAIEEITAETIPTDFARNPKIHNCWRIVRC